ncbi:MAG: CHC2 zinc finger domain-containing protein, partial [Deltaproteobacteria bacterium]|nr:CHC2 zinc finger domain-containing protein [Deltaproteobacteria bacterium]
MLISSEQIREIRNTVNLADIIGKRINLKMAGSRLRARCPFHDEKTPSFFVDPTRNSFICFGCGEKGDVYDFLMKYDGLTFVEAVKRAADEAGIVLKQVDNAKEKELREKQARKNSLYQVNAKVTKFFQEKLVAAEGAQCRQYLQNRGIGDEAVKEFKLGFAPDSWDALLSYLQKTGDLAAAESNGLVRPGK